MAFYISAVAYSNVYWMYPRGMLLMFQLRDFVREFCMYCVCHKNKDTQEQKEQKEIASLVDYDVHY